MKRKIAVIGVLFVLGATLGPAPGSAEQTGAFRELAGHYEAVRRALVEDHLEGVPDHARAMEDRSKELLRSFDSRVAGVRKEDADACRGLLPELASAAARLAGAGDIAGAREALFELSKPMGRYRKLAGIEGTMVVYCPMAKKAWIQPEGPVGNPYLGQQMPMCGSRVAE